MVNTVDLQSGAMEECLRWFGPPDPVPLSDIRQTGASAVFTSLHEIPVGDVWPRDAIARRKAQIEAAGLRLTVVESVPVHEEIKIGRGDLSVLFENYRQTLRNLAAEGIYCVVYNFMPVLDWIRTEIQHRLPDGSECLYYDPARFAAFDIFALQRHNARADYTPDQLSRAGSWWDGLNAAARDQFIQNIIDVFPGCKLGLGLQDIRGMLARYAGLDAAGLRNNLARFLTNVVPTAQELGVRLAIHPDDPPFGVLGLPRIVSTEADIAAVLATIDSPSNGLCLCTGSLGAHTENDLTGITQRFTSRINAVHLRSVQHLADGSFFEADHLAGSVDMPAIMQILLDEQRRRLETGRADWRLSFRPDHGHTMLDDLQKTVSLTPGYSCIGRLRGLAELRGLMLGLLHARRGVRV